MNRERLNCHLGLNRENRFKARASPAWHAQCSTLQEKSILISKTETSMTFPTMNFFLEVLNIGNGFSNNMLAAKAAEKENSLIIQSNNIYRYKNRKVNSAKDNGTQLFKHIRLHY